MYIIIVLIFPVKHYRCCRRNREHEQKLIQDAAAKRIEELVNKRVEEELEKRKEEIEAEVARRIEEVKKIMEKEMMEELERRKMQLLEEEKKREVRNGLIVSVSYMYLCIATVSRQPADCIPT